MCGSAARTYFFFLRSAAERFSGAFLARVLFLARTG